MYLDSIMRPKILAGQYCPNASEIGLEFLLSSDKLGEATEVITIPIIPFIPEEEKPEQASISNFAGVNVDEVDAALAKLNA